MLLSGRAPDDFMYTDWFYGTNLRGRRQAMGIDIRHTHTVEVGYDEFCGALAARDLKPLWKIAKQLMPEVPLPTTQAWLWKWDDVLPLARRAGELITLERGGDRRVLALANPGLRGLPFTSTTLWARSSTWGHTNRHRRTGIRPAPSGSSSPARASILRSMATPVIWCR